MMVQNPIIVTEGSMTLVLKAQGNSELCKREGDTG